MNRGHFTQYACTYICTYTHLSLHVSHYGQLIEENFMQILKLKFTRAKMQQHRYV